MANLPKGTAPLVAALTCALFGLGNGSLQCTPLPQTPVGELRDGVWRGTLTVEARQTTFGTEGVCVGDLTLTISRAGEPQVTGEASCEFEGELVRWTPRAAVALDGSVGANGSAEGHADVTVHHRADSRWSAQLDPDGALRGEGTAFCSGSGSQKSFEVRYHFEVWR